MILRDPSSKTLTLMCPACSSGMEWGSVEFKNFCRNPSMILFLIVLFSKTVLLAVVNKYRIGQLYMISKHSHEQSDRGEGVEVVQNEPYEDPNHGNANCLAGLEQLFPKYFMLQRRLGIIILIQSQCSFLPKFSIHIETKYEDNKGSNDSIFDKEAKDLEREVCFIDIASDEIPERYYKESEDPKYFKSQKTGRGQLKEGWRETHQPIMCSYKLVTVKFEVWGLQTRVEQFVHKVVRDILLIGHRQAFAWVDEWYDMTMDDVREYEKNMHEKTNIKVCNQHSSTVDEIESHAQARVCQFLKHIAHPQLIHLHRSEKSNQLILLANMTMDEVREFERATQEATNKKIGIFPPAISISNISMPSSTRSAPSSAPSTPLSTDAPEFLTVPKDRPRKKSAPETLTLPDPAKKTL
ncbi:cytoplasmic phosphatidylinositol transfer protein 1 isoform x2 [Limosa lapponica baueri]|uniref:Cytoplasmic phosphatidylinositol transfer protein 1 isoform x2 n=1 Tax=Limosa lapponica baueri TaxID=1758121 RepID=A0A2I0U8I8_LIMLA|nr:cytoplasmic phosphatidylinositol transfer protein 1 isoform x2 [Limosa lapponica baueri]